MARKKQTVLELMDPEVLSGIVRSEEAYYDKLEQVIPGYRRGERGSELKLQAFAQIELGLDYGKLQEYTFREIYEFLEMHRVLKSPAAVISAVGSGAAESTDAAIGTVLSNNFSFLSPKDLIAAIRSDDYSHNAFADFVGITDHQFKEWRLRRSRKWDLIIRSAAVRWASRRASG